MRNAMAVDRGDVRKVKSALKNKAFLSNITWLFASLVLFAILTLLISNAEAKGPGTTTGQLLKIPVGARAIGMGEAYTGLADDVSALSWNPAGIGFLEFKEASFMHSALADGIHYEHAAIAVPGESYGFAGSLSYLGYGDIEGFDNVTGAATGNVSAYSMLATGGVSKQASKSLVFGLTGSVLREKLENESANTMSFNLGTLYRLPFHPLEGNYQLGASVLNVGPGLKFIEDRDPLPTTIRVGASASSIKGLPLNATLDIVKPTDNSAYMAAGFEYWLKNVLALRLGYLGLDAEGSGLRMGIGIKLSSFLLDYAYGSFGDLGSTHRISASFRWGVRTIQISQAERALMREARLSTEQGDLSNAIMTYNEILDRNPENERAFTAMISAHEKMLKKDLQDAVTDIAADGIDAKGDNLSHVAVNPNAVPNGSGYNPADPLGLENLPSAENLEGAVASVDSSANGAALTFQPLMTQSATTPTGPAAMPESAAPAPQATPESAPSQQNSAPALNMGDIYGTGNN